MYVRMSVGYVCVSLYVRVYVHVYEPVCLPRDIYPVHMCMRAYLSFCTHTTTRKVEGKPSALLRHHRKVPQLVR